MEQVIYFDEPRITRRWTDSDCGTAEEWIQTSDGRTYKSIAGAKHATVILKGPAEPATRARELNRHERRAAASQRHWKNRKNR